MCVTPAGKIGNCTWGMPNCCQIRAKKKSFFAPPIRSTTVSFHFLSYLCPPEGGIWSCELLASPSYMPIGWWLTVVQFGYLGLRLADLWPAWAAVGVPTALGMTLPPYEEFAPSARAWYYPPQGVMLSTRRSGSFSAS